MFDYAQRLKLALGDQAKSTAMKAVAGLVMAVGAGFLIAALWTFLADDLDWGATVASLIIAVLFLVIGVIVFVTSKPKHEIPSTDELKREVEARVDLAVNSAIDKARVQALRVVDMAENKAQSVIDKASFRANKLADDAEKRVYGMARQTARKVGLTPEKVDAVKDKAAQAASKVSAGANSNAGSMAKLLTAFAVGVTIAASLGGRRRDDDDGFDDYV